MASLFYQQLLPYEQLAELEQQNKCALLSKDTIIAINAIERKASAYELLNHGQVHVNVGVYYETGSSYTGYDNGSFTQNVYNRYRE